jgi:hypothetical protein
LTLGAGQRCGIGKIIHCQDARGVGSSRHAPRDEEPGIGVGGGDPGGCWRQGLSPGLAAAEHPVEDLTGSEAGQPGVDQHQVLLLERVGDAEADPWSQSPWRVRTLTAFLATSSRWWAVTSNT